MERHHRPTLTLFADQAFEIGVDAPLADDAAHHAHVRRARAGDAVRLVDDRGRVCTGRLQAVERRRATVVVDAIATVEPPIPLHLVVPVADRDHMLLAAEKAVEFQATAWHPVRFSRSRSVGTRGEGERFREKMLARMRSALEQCGAAWLPRVNAEQDPDEAFRTVAPDVARYLLDAGGGPLGREPLAGAAVALAVGPEGGLEPAEIALADAAGWSKVSLGPTTLRFETALIAGAAVVRALQLLHGSTPHGR